MTTTEEWRVIPSLPTHEASSLGRVRCIPFEGTMPHGGKRMYGGHASKGLWCTKTKRYVFTYNGKNFKIARLVCEAFNGPCPPGLYCLHKDENSRNNVPSNLKWGTQEENLNMPKFLEYCRGRIGDKNPYIKGTRI